MPANSTRPWPTSFPHRRLQPASCSMAMKGRLSDFAGDLREAKAKALVAVQWPFHKDLLTGKTTHAAWRSKPSWYATSTEDRTINPDLQRFMAKRMGAGTIEVKASHVSLISQPETIANLILEAAGRYRSQKPAALQN